MNHRPPQVSTHFDAFFAVLPKSPFARRLLGVRCLRSSLWGGGSVGTPTPTILSRRLLLRWGLQPSGRRGDLHLFEPSGSPSFPAVRFLGMRTPSPLATRTLQGIGEGGHEKRANYWSEASSSFVNNRANRGGRPGLFRFEHAPPKLRRYHPIAAAALGAKPTLG